ncbi:MAG: ABC transporter ATP-binding protein [Bacteroidetes bacterium]|nr:MAG: ABC transporter ATP-binding protein [Bacteroidota bacterium]
MPNPPAIITARNLTKYYGQHLGIRDVSFQVNEGDVFGFLGPNGAGKTTTIRILLDLLRPDSGRVELVGLEVRKNSFTIRKQLGYLPGEFSANEHLSGFAFFKLISRIRNVPFNEDSLLFQRFDLSRKELSKKIKALSHGTLQKIGIIQALFHHPRVLILDEPTTGLDPLMKEVFYEILFEEQHKGTTIFFSSHNLYEVEKLCTRVAIIRKGEIAGVESLAALQENAGQLLEFTLTDAENVIELPGAELIRHQGTQYTYQFRGDISALLKRLSELPVRNVSISKPDLEELFMHYYHDKSGKEDDLS